MQEIEELGEQEEWEEERAEKKESGSFVPLLQTAVCVLILLVLLFLKFTDEERYGEAVQWYKKEAAQEIQLPEFGKREAEEGTEVRSAPNAPSDSQEDVAVQRI